MTNNEVRDLYQQGMDWCDVLLEEAKASGEIDVIFEQTAELMWLSYAMQKLSAIEAEEAINASNT